VERQKSRTPDKEEDSKIQSFLSEVSLRIQV